MQSRFALNPSTKKMASVGQRAKRTGQGKVAASATEAAWMAQVAAYGCIVCRQQHGIQVPAEVHHILSGGRRMGHLFSIGLCPAHHRGGAGDGLFISRHPYKARFEQAYGTELELLEELRALLNLQSA